MHGPRNESIIALYMHSILNVIGESFHCWLSFSLNSNQSWESWNACRFHAGHNPNLFLCLEISENITYVSYDMDIWLAEPVKLVVISTKCFSIDGSRGKPLLQISKGLQTLIVKLGKIKVNFAISGSPLAGFTLAKYVRFMESLISRAIRRSTSEYAEFCATYQDSLKQPLQPLADNLDSLTYTVMEEDPVKYQRYEEAIHLALTDLSQRRQGTDRRIVVAVLGPGRGEGSS